MNEEENKSTVGNTSTPITPEVPKESESTLSARIAALETEFAFLRGKLVGATESVTVVKDFDEYE